MPSVHIYEPKIHMYGFYKRPTSDLGKHRWKVRGWKKVFHANGNHNKAVVTIQTK